MFVQHSQIPSPGKKGVTGPGILRSGIAACSIILGFCTSILIAQTLGPADFGIYTYVLWLATVGTPAIGVGMSTLTSRHIIEIEVERRFVYERFKLSVVRMKFVGDLDRSNDVR